MSRVRFNFLNWRPDQEDFGNDGLSVADNVIHDTEGWLQVTRGTYTSASTMTGGTETMISAKAIQIRPIGPGRTVGASNYGLAIIADGATDAWILGVAESISGTTITPNDATTYALANITAMGITSFDSCSLGDYVFMCGTYFVEETGGTVINGGVSGYLDIS